MSDSAIEQLISLCRSNDVDVRVDTVTKLQAEFEAGAEIQDTDGLLTALKSCLRTANQHLTTATVSAIPPLLPLLISRPGLGASQSTISPHASTSSAAASAFDVPVLRQVLNAFLPPGGVLDRLGDSRDRAREKARETLVLLGGYAFRSSPASAAAKAREGKGPEPPLAIFERHFKEHGLGSRVWRVREQALLALCEVRRAHHLFPLRPFLPPLVDALEDSDSNVRTQALASVIALFTGPGVTDAARADLKKEMAKKNVRKTIVESVTARLLAASGAGAPPPLDENGSENGDGGGTYVPPSMALANKTPGPRTLGRSVSRSVSGTNVEKLSRPASRAAAASPVPADPAIAGGSEVKTVYIASSRDLDHEFANMLKHFEGKEDEHNWAARERAIVRVRGMIKGEVHERFTEAFLNGLKNGFIDASLKTASAHRGCCALRTTVAANTCSLYAELAATLGTALDAVCETLYINLLKLASLTKKIIAQQSQATLTTIITHTSPMPRIVLPLLSSAVHDKAVQTRTYALGHIKTYLAAHGQRAKHAIEGVSGVETLERCLKKGLSDPNPAAKEAARQAFWVFEEVWRERGRAILESLDTLARRQLEKACPKPELLAELPAVAATPQVKKSSVAAAIAASRAKAKAIATAPPSLRHQATSAARTTSPPAKRSASPSLGSSSGPSGPPRAHSPINRVPSSSSSPPPPRARVVSAGTLPRSTASGFVPTRDHARTAVVPESPPSPTPEYRRRLSSPLAGSPNGSSLGSLRRAAQTALPASPPRGSVLLQSAALHGRPPPPAASSYPYRESINIAGMHAADEDSLLLASSIPIPEDSDSDMDLDTSAHLISFSSPYERYPPPPERAARSAASFSPRSSSSRPPLSNALSTGTSSPPAGVQQPMVEDAMRARAEQAESAAERLLELVDPEEDAAPPRPAAAPTSLRSSTGPERSAPKGRAAARGGAGLGSSPQGLGAAPVQPPRTPASKSTAIMRKAALFEDSPAYKARASTSPFDVINGGAQDNVWWRKRLSLVNEGAAVRTGEPSDRREELDGLIAALEQGPADVRVLKKLALFCRQHPVNEPISPISPDFSGPLSPSPSFGTTRTLPDLSSDLWIQDKAFERLFAALVQSLDPCKGVSELEYGLIVLWEMLEHQAPLLEGREADIFAVLLRVRNSGHATVLLATTNFRDMLASRIGPVYGLTTLHASLRAFRQQTSSPADLEITNGTYAFGLIALGKFILRLPAEVLEDELPRLRITLTSALTDMSSESSLVVREAAAASIIAAQLVLRDEAHLFLLLDGLPEDKKNLLTYLFDKHHCRGSLAGAGAGGLFEASGMDKLEREMRRLDGRTSLAPLQRPTAAGPSV
ncbi:hypothetical protein PHLGIDRAFT_97512 [Phlebiopsis gigantea 11061_1 CR5-6]|uniref:TOG domain-containing protein n=1 Tax=Phlebiopsis gigantea (strain 11061_1 CR5-6) TaxID=745531 RepID=A0A0C3S860_PHLG1|nr:hypothetical protein PHLGIDRAFT_97512 [Phlebiopsis gigantea 11061_1 CR5-6]